MSCNRGKGRGITFLREHVSYQGDDCLIWPLSVNYCGYGKFGFNGKPQFAHRWICEAAHGAPPTPGHYAAHECGNGHKGCVNPKHLKWKTHAENSQDSVRDGRLGRRWASRKLRKLSHEQVLQILNPPEGKTLKQLSDEFGVTYLHCVRIRKGNYWKDGLPQKTRGRGVHHALIYRKAG